MLLGSLIPLNPLVNLEIANVVSRFERIKPTPDPRNHSDLRHDALPFAPRDEERVAHMVPSRTIVVCCPCREGGAARELKVSLTPRSRIPRSRRMAPEATGESEPLIRAWCGCIPVMMEPTMIADAAILPGCLELRQCSRYAREGLLRVKDE